MNMKMIYSKFNVWCQEIGIIKKDILKMPTLTEHFQKEKNLKSVRIGKTNKYHVRFIEEEEDIEEQKTASTSGVSVDFKPDDI